MPAVQERVNQMVSLPSDRDPGEAILVDGLGFYIRGAFTSMSNNGSYKSTEEGVVAFGLQPAPETPFADTDHWTLVRYKADGDWGDVRVYCANSNYDHHLDGTRLPATEIN